MNRIAPSEYSTRVLFGFTAGFLATLSFIQLSLWVLWSVGIAPFGPFTMAAVKPFGVPALISSAFWGGIRGILFAFVERRFPARAAYWVAAFLFGAVLLSPALILIVLPLKGSPLGAGWHPPLVLTAFIANGAWGIGTALFLWGMKVWFSRRRHSAA